MAMINEPNANAKHRAQVTVRTGNHRVVAPTGRARPILTRREVIALPIACSALGAVQGLLQPGAVFGAQAINEDDPGNIKLAHRLSARISDEDLRFLQQIGLKWARGRRSSCCE